MDNFIETLSIAKGKEMYDGNIKRILSEKQILARILKETVEEVKNLDYDEIIACIGSEILIGKVGVENSNSPFSPFGEIETLSEEDYLINEGKITYDIRFDLYLMNSGIIDKERKEQIKLLINIEAQKEFNPGYDLVPRGIFYCARMISSQLGKEIKNSNYDDVCKVYSIWICMETPKDVENTVFSYELNEKMLYGEKHKNFRSDLLTLVMVCLPRKINEEHTLQNMLRVLLDSDISVESKEDILSKEYGIKMDDNMKEEARYMCNLSDLVEERGIRKGMEQGLAQGIEQGMEQGLSQGIVQGKQIQLIELYKAGLIDKEKTLELLGVAEDEFEEMIKEI